MLHEKGPRRVQPVLHPRPLINLASGQVSIRIRPQGSEPLRWSPPARPAPTPSATPARLIAFGDADVMVAGGAEVADHAASASPASPPAARCRPASTTRPSSASRPYDKDRDGFVMGEGAGVVVLEEYEHAKARGAKIYAEVIGYGLSGDAYHITAPAEDGDGALPLHERGDQARRHRAGRHRLHQRPRHLDAARRRDRARRGRAAGRQCGRASISMSSTKSSIGHLLGAAGAVEAIFSLLAMRDQIAPPTHQSRQSVGRDADRPRAAQARKRDDRRRAVELLRLRRHQRLAGLPPRCAA